MKIIDFHTHIYPDKIAEKASQATGDFYHIKPSYSGTSKELLSTGRKAGISRFVLLPVATKPNQVRSINRFICDEVAAHDEFYGFGTIKGCLKYLTIFRERYRCLYTAVISDLTFHIHAV